MLYVQLLKGCSHDKNILCLYSKRNKYLELTAGNEYRKKQFYELPYEVFL
jgi:hypothetical protein